MQTADLKNDDSAVGAIFADEQQPSAKLDDAEIARLVSLSSQASYHRTDSIPIKPKEQFQPRTLVNIAMEAQRRLEEAEQQAAQARAAEQVAGDADGAEETGRATSEETAPDAGVTAEPAATQADAGQSSVDNAQADDPEAAMDAAVPDENIELSEEEIAAAAEAEKLQAEYDRGFAAGRAEGEDAGNKAGHDKGYEAGRAAGQAEATAQLEKAIQGFESATLALASSAALDVDALMTSINAAIISLASERAGGAIDQLPEGFASRIEAILAGIKANSDAPQIILNPDDMQALKPIIENREKLRKCTLSADQSLARGDVKISIEGIGVEDILGNRAGLRPASENEIDHADEVDAAKDAPAVEEASAVDADASSQMDQGEQSSETGLKESDTVITADKAEGNDAGGSADQTEAGFKTSLKAADAEAATPSSDDTGDKGSDDAGQEEPEA